MLWLGIGGNLGDSQVKALDNDDQEIAVIEPATSSEDWGRLVTALQLLQADWPRINPGLPALQLSLDDAFPTLTATVPDIALWFAGTANQKLRLRWYKISGEHDTASWIKKLHARPRQPLAILGGGTSERAAKLAGALKRAYDAPVHPESASPLLLLTTATAELTAKGNPLIEVYPQRSFRFSFTNPRMVDALLDFVGKTPDLWVDKPSDPPVLPSAVASIIGRAASTGSAIDCWHTAGVLHAMPHLQPYTMHAVPWQDERYSQDMTALFEKKFKKQYPLSEFFPEGEIPYSVGGFFDPAPLEQATVDFFLARPVTPHSFLVLPTQTVRMRRVLINLRQRSPLDARNLVILNGDAISFHSVWRDRDVVWNILDLPYSLVFFSHRNPIDAAAGFTWTRDDSPEAVNAFPQKTTSGTHDLLLYRDIFEAFLYAAYDQGKLLGDPQMVRARLQATCWVADPLDGPRVRNPKVEDWPGEHRPFFDAAGNRQSHTGEHIVWVKPNFTDDRVDKTSKISVWAPDNGNAWRLVEDSPEDAP